jgi:hypothetical protein
MYMANMGWNSSMNVPGTLKMLTDKDPATGDYKIPRIIYSDAYPRLHLAGRAPFIRRCHEKGLAAFVRKRPGDRAEAQAVGVGFDDACTLCTARGFVQAGPVCAQGFQVDSQDGARR